MIQCAWPGEGGRGCLIVGTESGSRIRYCLLIFSTVLLHAFCNAFSPSSVFSSSSVVLSFYSSFLSFPSTVLPFCLSPATLHPFFLFTHTPPSTVTLPLLDRLFYHATVFTIIAG